MRNTQNRTFSDRGAVADRGWVWGRHAVLAALANPRREVYRLLVTLNAARELPEGLEHTLEKPDAIGRQLPDTAVHQGFAAEVSALKPETVRGVEDPTHGLLIVLDQITDPHNVGAIFRSAAAFKARAVVMQDRKSPPLFGTVCKSAVGCTEVVSHVRVTNIADTLSSFSKAGRHVIGLAGEAEADLHSEIEANAGPGLVLVLGAEDKGLRPRVADHCDTLARIAMSDDAESLNVSNAAAIALYEAYKQRKTP